MVMKLGRGIAAPVLSGASSRDRWAGKALTPPLPPRPCTQPRHQKAFLFRGLA